MPITIVTTTVASQTEAEQLAAGAVQAQHAACAQVEPITAHYVWEGALEQSSEWRVVLKTTDTAAPALGAWLQAHHPYALPQLLLRTEWADRAYASWVAESVTPSKK